MSADASLCRTCVVLRALAWGLFVALLDASPAFGQTLGQAPDDTISIWRVAFALLLCLGLAVAGAYAIKARLGMASPLALFSFAGERTRRLQLIESLRLTQKSDLCLVRCDGRELLFLTSDHGVQVIEPGPRIGGNFARPSEHAE